jgi:hypothetical protein
VDSTDLAAESCSLLRAVTYSRGRGGGLLSKCPAGERCHYDSKRVQVRGNKSVLILLLVYLSKLPVAKIIQRQMTMFSE